MKNWNYEPDILGIENFFKAAVLVPLVFINNEYHFLFQKRATNIRQGGEVSFPGGKYEDSDKNFQVTAIRETCEEIGISEDKIKVLKELGTLVSPFESIIKSYLGIININSLDELNINKEEVEKVFLVPVDFILNTQPEIFSVEMEINPHQVDENFNIINTFPAKKYNLPDKYHKKWKGNPRKIFLYEYSGEIIWGFTAFILKDTIEKIKVSLKKT
jgi:8-oxo-dGTP pyrophosphatase MutT (NUDIX family)